MDLDDDTFSMLLSIDDADHISDDDGKYDENCVNESKSFGALSSSNIVDIAKHKKSMIWNEFEDMLEEEGMRLPKSDFVASPDGSFSLSQSADYNDARSATDLENMFQDFLKAQQSIILKSEELGHPTPDRRKIKNEIRLWRQKIDTLKEALETKGRGRSNKKNLPKETVVLLKEFYNENDRPSEDERRTLAKQTGQEINTINNWFTNQRSRNKTFTKGKRHAEVALK